MSAGINYADVQALVQRGVNRGLLKRGAPMTPVAPEDLPKTAGTFRHVPEPVWASVDWSKGNRDIEKLLGLAEGSVSYQRKKRAPHTVVPRSRWVRELRQNFQNSANSVQAPSGGVS